jgi:UDP-N-acetylmuramate: L-alanyl-gamma-D-glutamyl-meso-diaminopimelate ligase
VAENFGRSYGLGGGAEFILEGDEYETAFFDRGPKFFHYHPEDLVITSLEYDHADIYPSFELYEQAFKRLVNLVPRRGRVILWGDAAAAGPALRRVADKAFCPVVTYGFEPGNDWLAGDLLVEGPVTRFRAVYRGAEVAEVMLSAAGRHNVLNALAAVAVAHGRGVPPRAMEQALLSYRNVRRRMDLKGEVRGVLVVDDFAHHPTAIGATIEAARLRWPGRRLWAVVEPRSNSMRRKIFESVLPGVLVAADRVLIGPVSRPAQLDDSERLSPKAVAEAVHTAGKPAEAMPSADAITEHLAQEAAAGDLILIMSNGSFDGLCEKLLTRLRDSRRPSQREAKSP